MGLISARSEHTESQVPLICGELANRGRVPNPVTARALIRQRKGNGQPLITMLPSALTRHSMARSTPFAEVSMVGS